MGRSASKEFLKVVAWLMQGFMVSIQNRRFFSQDGRFSRAAAGHRTTFEQVAQSHADARRRDPPLAATVAIANRHGFVRQRLAVHGDAERSSGLVLPAIPAADGSLLVVRDIVVPLELAVDRLGPLRHAIAFDE